MGTNVSWLANRDAAQPPYEFAASDASDMMAMVIWYYIIPLSILSFSRYDI